jgi:threonine/homoserine/homoserine lactone efflux protein
MLGKSHPLDREQGGRMSTSAVLLAILATLLVGAISPGPSFLLVSRISVVQSRGHGLAAALGMGVGGTVFAGLALLGLAALLSQIVWLDAMLKLAGGAYLIWLGIRI